MKRLSFWATALVVVISFLLWVAVEVWLTAVLNWPRSINWIFALFGVFGIVEIISHIGPEPFDTILQKLGRLVIRDRVIIVSSFFIGTVSAICLGYILILPEGSKFWISTISWFVITFVPIGLFGTPQGKYVIFKERSKNVNSNH